MEPQYSVHQSVRLQLHGGLQPHRKSAVRLGQQAFGHLSHHIRTNGGETLVSPVLNDAL